jgi:hypothetical protein
MTLETSSVRALGCAATGKARVAARVSVLRLNNLLQGWAGRKSAMRTRWPLAWE